MLPKLPAALLVTGAVALAPATALGADQGTLANGCYTATGAAAGVVGESLRLKPTALGRFLLYTKDQQFVSAQGDGSLAPDAAPSPAADFAVAHSGGGALTLAPESTKQVVATVTLAPAEGCAEFPEAPLNATGEPSKGKTSFGRVGGMLEAHMHWMAYQYFGGRFRCGQPWSEYGLPSAMPDCADREGPQGSAANFQNLVNYGNPSQPHSTENYPGFPNQSKTNLTYEGMYYRWVERVHRAGLRMMVMGVNENRVLCEMTPNKAESCNEMDTMRRGFKAIRVLEDYVDAQAGGDGKGFFEVVTDPFRAREVINEGRLAVVLEMETSEPFDCRGWEEGTITCDKAQISRQIDELHALGVRSSLLLNKFDNPLTGVRFDSGTTSYLINAGNKQSAGSFWSARTCKDGELTDNEINFGDPTGAINTVLTQVGVTGGTTPTYPPAPHCNTRGLTELGRFALKRMMDLGWIVNPDHMSQAAVDDTLTLLESRRYSGVISPHGWVDPGNWPRLWKLGGMAFPGHSATDTYVKDWKDYRPRETPYEFGWGYGADLGGLSKQPDRSKEGSISYPFRSYDGKVTFDKQTTGERTFDFTKEGVAQYGLYAEWFEDLRRVGGQQMADDMWAGAEAYLQMWERASGVPVKGCFRRHGVLKPTGRGQIRLGADWRAVLERAGQPQQRDRTWSWCVRGKRNGRKADVALMSRAGVVQLVGSTANKRRAKGFVVGEAARGRDGLRVRRSGGRVYTAVVRTGTVRAVGVTTTAYGKRRSTLRAAMARVLAAKASNRPRRFVPSEAQADGRMLGRTLATSLPAHDAD